VLHLNYQAVRDRRLPQLQRLSAIETVYVNLRDFQTTLALSARAEGVTWEEIGGTLGMSKQAAQQRFGKGVR
jgi:hypothetical protein